MRPDSFHVHDILPRECYMGFIFYARKKKIISYCFNYYYANYKKTYTFSQVYRGPQMKMKNQEANVTVIQL